jgi:hypothetical protein
MNRVNPGIDADATAGVFVKRILRGSALLLCAAAVSSCGGTQAAMRKYGNGHFMTSRDAGDGISRRTLWRLAGDGKEQVAEFTVVCGNVVTFMPTIIQEGDCIPQSMDIRNAIKGKFMLGGRNGDSFPFTIRVGPGTAAFRRILQDHAGSGMTRDELADFAKRVTGFSTRATSVLEVETPCRFELVDAALAELSRFSGGGISVVPATRHIPVPVPPRTVPDGLNDIEVDVHSL